MTLYFMQFGISYGGNIYSTEISKRYKLDIYLFFEST